MNTKVRALVAVCALLLSVSLTACGGGGDTASTPPAPSSFSVGGTVTGLSGSGLVLQDNGGGDLTVTGNGAFSFAAPVATGMAYSVAVKSQPTSPSQTCTVGSGAGTIASTNITSVSVSCVTNTYVVGGTVSGLAGSGLVLQDNGGNDLTVTGNGVFSFSAQVTDKAAYSVTVKSQPTAPRQTCSASNASGTIAGANITAIAVSCVTNTYAVGGTVSGLAGAGLVLQDDGGNDLPVAGNGAFSFSAPLADGVAYSVAVKTQPATPSQTCSVGSGTGAIAGANITSVTISCVTNSYSVGGLVSSLAGVGLVLQDNGGNDLPVTGNGMFAFTTPVPSGATYSVSVRTQPSSPSQTCSVGNGTGPIVAAGITSVSVSCVTNTFTVGGTIVGLLGPGLVLQDNSADSLTLSSNGTFSFPAQVLSGATYAVSVKTQPASPAQKCVVAGGSGLMAGTNVTTINVVCTTGPGRFAYVTAGTSVYVFAVDAVNGTLTAVDGSPFAATPQGSAASDIAVTPTGTFIYVVSDMVNQAQSNVTAFSVDATSGAVLQQVGTPAVVPGAFVLTMDPAGKYLYVNSSAGSGEVYAFSIDAATGLLSAVPGSPFNGGYSRGMRVDPTGQYLYVSNSQAGSVLGYSINPTTGALTAVPGSPFAASGQPVPIAIDPSGKFLYDAQDGNTLTSVSGIYSYTIASGTGTLSAITGSPFGTSTSPIGIAADLSGAVVYVTDDANTVTAYAINPTTGALTPISGSTLMTVATPRTVVTHPQGTFVYVGSWLGQGIQEYVLTSTPGILTSVGTTSALPAGALKIAIPSND